MNAPRSIFGSLGTSLFGSPAPPAPAPTTTSTQPKNTSNAKPTKTNVTTSRTLPAQPTKTNLTESKPTTGTSGQHPTSVDNGAVPKTVSQK